MTLNCPRGEGRVINRVDRGEGGLFEMFSQIARLHPGPGEWSGGRIFLEDQCPVRGKTHKIRFLVQGTLATFDSPSTMNKVESIQ